jgi:hypothetical protein
VDALLLLATTILFFLLLMVSSSPTAASRLPDQDNLPDNSTIPAEYGETIYRTEGNSPKMLYVVGISHRNPVNRVNAVNTVKTQIEIFRIGAWLNRARDLDILLPEGYFSKNADHAPGAMSRGGNELVSPPDQVVLQKRLSDESHFVNAEMLLMEQFNMHASQVEDRKIYDAVRSSLENLSADGFESFLPAARWAELQYLQQLRTAMLLQNIPAAIEDKVYRGMSRNHSAIFTIGLNHIQDIIRYFEANRIRIEAPASEDKRFANYDAELNLIRQGYEVTIIIPRTLADDRKLLQMTNLNQVLPIKESVPSTAMN